MDFHKLTYEQAGGVSALILPGVLQDPRAEHFWYLSASEKEKGFLGMAVVDPKKPQPELLSIGVLDEESGKGIGSELLAFAEGLLQKAGADSLRAVYAGEEEEWESLDPFFTLNGFSLLEEDHVYRITLGEILEKKFLRGTDRPAGGPAVAISSLTERSLRAFRDEIIHSGQFDVSVFDDCDPDYSYAWLEDDQVRALFLVGVSPDGELHNVWTWISQKLSDLRALQRLFVTAVKRAQKDFAADTPVNFPCLTPAGEKLLKYLLQDAKKTLSLRVYECPLGQDAEVQDESDGANGGQDAAGADSAAADDGQEGADADSAAADGGQEGADADSAAEGGQEAADSAAADGGTPAESTFADRQRDAVFNLVGNDELICALCAHCQEDSTDSCAKYSKKPGAVYYGGGCPQFEEE